ncbi:MAG: ATP-binding protein [Pseudomonadaceae bacterium]|nr:ATP-binding protein [Pseudomonadaceae bacterium]
MSILEYTGLGLILLAPVSVFILTPLLPLGIRYWLWGWALVMVTGPLQIAALKYPELVFVAQGIGVFFPMCLLAGSFGFVDRPVPKWVFYLAGAAFALRAGLASADLVMAARIAALPLEVIAYLMAAWVLNESPAGRQRAHIFLAITLASMAAVEVWDTLTNDPTRSSLSSGLPWVIAFVVTGAVQIWAWLDKSMRERSASLRSANERFDALVNRAEDIIVEVNSSAEFVYVSPNCQKVLGISTKEMIGKRIDDFMAQLSTEHQGEHFEFEDPGSLSKIVEAGPFGELYKVRHPDGSPRFLEITASHYFNSQGEIRAVGVVRDITRRVKDEQSNLSRQKLESLGTMSAGIAHDFRNLLTTIRGSTELLQLDLHQSEAAQADVHIANILSASDQAAGLTDQLLTYAGKTPLVMSEISLKDLITDSVPLLKTVIADRAHLYTNLENGIPPIQGNRVALQQVLINLITNAAEALPEQDGKIWISLVTDLSETGQTSVAMKVTDNGRGMEESIKTHIFEPFYSTKFAGRGLGLAAIQGLVTAHNGQITVDSFPGQGATFTLTFPGTAQNETANQGFGG